MNARYLTAIVVIEKNAPSTINEDIILQRFNDLATKEKLNGFERIKAVKLTREPFTTQNGMSTPSLKLCRFKIQQVYQKELDEMDNKLKVLH